MPSWYYFNKPSNFAFHDLTTSIKPPPNLRTLLGNSLKFIPTKQYTHTAQYITNNTMDRLNHDLEIKMYYAGQSIDNDKDFDSSMYIKSDWTPPPWGISDDLSTRALNFGNKLKAIFKKKRGKSNLLPHHRNALRALQKRDDLMIVQCDKNLGPAVIEKAAYIQTAFRDHLNDTKTYKVLTPFQAQMRLGQLALALQKWIAKYADKVNSHCKKYMTEKLETNEHDRLSYLYLTMKVHKNETPCPSRPICSCSGSLLEPLGQAINKLLQPFAQKQPYYLKNSLDLKQKLEALGPLPPNSYLFTADARSMYTNLPIDHAIQCIKEYLQSFPDPDDKIPIVAIVSGLKLLMHNNMFKFGDCTFLQTDGTAMGTPPAPPVAQISYGTHELNFVPEFVPNLKFYSRYIDDVIGIYTITNSDEDHHTWALLQARMNAFPGLTWDISARKQSVDFLDLTISIGEDRRINTTLYEKPLNLHLYLPPHSSHPPGVLLGLVYGNVRRIHTLCSNPQDKINRTQEMFKHLISRGFKAPDLLPIFDKAIKKANDTFIDATPAAELDTNPVFLHLQYHPGDPPACAIQQAWRDCVSHPPNRLPLDRLRNYAGNRSGMSQLIVAYSRPHNIGNLLSYRKLNSTGPTASSFMSRDDDGA